MDRCQGKTLKGKRCKRAAQANSPYCYQHVPKTRDTEWTLSIYVNATFAPRENMTKKARNALNAKIRRGPAQKTTGPGYVYIFRLTDDCLPNLWKIGSTTKSLEGRMNHWQTRFEKFPLGKLKLERALYVDEAEFCERLIHLYFDDVRVYRYECGNALASIWKLSGKALTPQDKTLLKETPRKGHKHIEWFELEDVQVAIDLMTSLSLKKFDK